MFVLVIVAVCDRDEELLSHGLELNDSMQSVLAKHDAIASGSPLPTQVTNLNTETLAVPQSSLKPGEVKETIQTPIANPLAPVIASMRGQIAEEEDEEDDFTQLARRLVSYSFIVSHVFLSVSRSCIEILVHITHAQQDLRILTFGL